jgi:hypothetical protein
MRLDDYRSTDLAGAAYLGAILADGFDVLDDSDPAGLTEGPCDPEVRAVFEEVYGPAMAVADLPF